jgi:hypothetical protein
MKNIKKKEERKKKKYNTIDLFNEKFKTKNLFAGENFLNIDAKIKIDQKKKRKKKRKKKKVEVL